MRRYLSSKLLTLALVVLVVVLVDAAWGMYQKQQFARQRRAQSEEGLEELQLRKESLEAELARLSDARGIEAELRDKFPVAEEGEHIIVLVEPEEARAQQEGAIRSFWQSVLDFFGRN